MRVLRITHWNGPHRPRTIAVVRDCDTVDTLESHRQGEVTNTNKLGSFMTTDLFEMDDADLEAAILEAGRRTREAEQTERDQSVMYYWAVSQWPTVKANGTLLSDRPAPLSEAEIKEVFEQLTRHPDYQGYGWVLPDKNSNIVTLQDRPVPKDLPERLAQGFRQLRRDHPEANIKYDLREGERGAYIEGRIDDRWHFAIAPEGGISLRPLS